MSLYWLAINRMADWYIRWELRLLPFVHAFGRRLRWFGEDIERWRGL